MKIYSMFGAILGILFIAAWIFPASFRAGMTIDRDGSPFNISAFLATMIFVKQKNGTKGANHRFTKPATKGNCMGSRIRPSDLMISQPASSAMFRTSLAESQFKSGCGERSLKNESRDSAGRQSVL